MEQNNQQPGSAEQARKCELRLCNFTDPHAPGCTTYDPERTRDREWDAASPPQIAEDAVEGVVRVMTARGMLHGLTNHSLARLRTEVRDAIAASRRAADLPPRVTVEMWDRLTEAHKQYQEVAQGTADIRKRLGLDAAPASLPDVAMPEQLARQVREWTKERDRLDDLIRFAAQPAKTVDVAMPRIPTDAMLNAARDWSVKKYSQGIGNDAAIGCWQAMYDAAEGSAQVATLPERDQSKPAEQQGLFRKFDVRRVDGSDQPGGKHYGCRYYVLDLTHDQHAPATMRAYAAACRVTHPQLADDIEAEFGATPAAVVRASPAEQADIQEKQAKTLRADLKVLQSFVNDLDDGEVAKAFYNVRGAVITYLHGCAGVAAEGATPAGDQLWHAPGMGEIHSHDHRFSIECMRETNDEAQPHIMDDDLAKRVCAALNRARIDGDKHGEQGGKA